MLWELFATFFKIGAFTFGGGLATMLVCVRRFKLHPIIFIAASGVLGALLSM